MGNESKQDILTEALQYATIEVDSKADLFLRLCSLNYLNALVKLPDFKQKLDYGLIKPKALQLAIDLQKFGKKALCEEISVREDEDCLYIRCMGLQFSFHHVNAKLLIEAFPELSNPEAKWDGIRLQPVATQLYELGKETYTSSLKENIVVDRIKHILPQYGQLQNYNQYIY